ncbi:hypothetical protein PENNAL_c0810G04172, partial [Penicillium nalgiovense]
MPSIVSWEYVKEYEETQAQDLNPNEAALVPGQE